MEEVLSSLVSCRSLYSTPFPDVTYSFRRQNFTASNSFWLNYLSFESLVCHLFILHGYSGC